MEIHSPSILGAPTVTTDNNPSLLIQPVTATVDAVLKIMAHGAIAGSGGHADLQMYDNATLGARFIGAFGNVAGSRYAGIVASKDRDGNNIPLRLFTNNSGGVTTDAIFIGAGSSQGNTGVRTSDMTITNGLYVPWKSGDTLPTSQFGSLTTGNNQNAVNGFSDTGLGIRGLSNGNSGVRADTNTASMPAIYAAQLLGNAASLSRSIDLSVRATSPANGLGSSIRWLLKSTTTVDNVACTINGLWVDATHATRKAALTLNAGDSVTTREVLRIEASGSAGLLSFFGGSAQVKQTSGADLTNNVTAGGSSDVIADFAASSYATDAATIRNDIYQLARKLKQINDGLRAYGLFT